MSDAAFAALGHREAALAKHVQHGHILGEHIRLEPRQTSPSRQFHEMPQEQACGAATSMGGSRKKCDFRGFRPISRLACVTSASYQGLPVGCLHRDYQGHHAIEVDGRKLLELRGRQLLLRAEEAPIDRFTVKVSNASRMEGASCGRMARTMTLVPSFNISGAR